MSAGANPLEVSRRAGRTSVSITLDRYGHLFPQAEDGLNDRLEALIPRPHKLIGVSESGEPTASPRPELIQVSSEDKEIPTDQGACGGASWNRTSDLSIISAAL